MSKHLCETCFKHVATCAARNVVFSIDKNPELRGTDADRVIECDSYEISQRSPNKPVEVPDE